MTTRISVAVLAAIAFVLSVYMALYQLGGASNVWDPLGGSQTARVLHFFHGFPDAALGAVAYAGEIVLPFIAQRRTLVIVYGLLSLSLALGGIGLVAMQMFVVHAICFLCCCTATLSVVIFAIALRDVIPAATRRDRDL